MNHTVAAENPRKAAYEIDPVYLNRWSPRSFTDQEIPDAKTANSRAS